MKEIITQEELNKILINTAMSLPDNPSERGMKPSTIKAFFYKYISVLVNIINDKLSGIESTRADAMNEHDISDSSHRSIRELIRNLQDKDVELGTAIGTRVQNHDVSESAHNDIRLKISNDIFEHDSSTKAHPFLQKWIDDVYQRANDAYNLASGRAKIIPVKDVEEMMQELHPDLNIGDRFILSDQNVPDFTLFEKNSTNTEAIELSSLSILLGLKIEPGKIYICNGYLLVASESGIDTDLFARAAALNALIETVASNKAEADKSKRNFETELAKKETKKELRQESAQTVVLTTDTEFNLGLRTSVILEPPSVIPSEFEVIVNFRSGQLPTAFDAPSDIIFTQDDCFLGALTPIANRIYEINIKNVGGVLIAKVGSADYEVIE